MRCQDVVGLMLSQCHRRWSNIKQKKPQRLNCLLGYINIGLPSTTLYKIKQHWFQRVVFAGL